MNAKHIAWITGSLTLLMALFSFILSFNALTDLAAKHGVSIPVLFPLVVEAAVVIFSLNALYRSINGEKVYWQWTLVIGSSLLAGTFNILHADSDIVSKIMSAMPSLFLLLSFETFLGQIKHNVKRQATVKRIEQLNAEMFTKQQEFENLILQKQSEVDAKCKELDEVALHKQSEIDIKQKDFDDLLSTKQAELNKLVEQVDAKRQELDNLKTDIGRIQNGNILHARRVKAEQDNADKESRLTQLIEILSVNPKAKVSNLAEQLNVSRQTIYNDLETLVSNRVIHKNGNGWEVSR